METFTYYPGCTLRTKAKDLDTYAGLLPKLLVSLLRSLLTGSAAAELILQRKMRSRPSFQL